MNRRGFVRNTALLTAEAGALRLSNIWFRGWVAGRLGAQGMGVYQLVYTVFSLGVVLSAAGASFTTMRLTAERGFSRVTLRRCVALSMGMSTLAAVLLLLLAPWLGPWLGGQAPLRILALGLPCIACCACLKGCFLAEEATGAPMAAELLEQAAGIALSFVLVGRMADPLTALMAASTLSEGVSCGFMALAYARRFARRRAPGGRPAPWRAALRIGGPVAAGAGLRSLLSTIENMLVPQGLGARVGRGEALVQYGRVQGMVMPMLQFPGSLLSSATIAVTPELARCCAAGRSRRIRLVAGRGFQLTLCFSFCAAGLVSAFAGPLCRTFYGGEETSWLLRVMAPLVPLLYVDSVVDGMLKALDQQGFSLRLNIADAALRVLWCLFALPHLGLLGYVLLLFGSEIFNAAFSICRLLAVAEVEARPFWVLLAAAGGSAVFLLSAAFLAIGK